MSDAIEKWLKEVTVDNPDGESRMIQLVYRETDKSFLAYAIHRTVNEYVKYYFPGVAIAKDPSEAIVKAVVDFHKQNRELK